MNNQKLLQTSRLSTRQLGLTVNNLTDAVQKHNPSRRHKDFVELNSSTGSRPQSATGGVGGNRDDYHFDKTWVKADRPDSMIWMGWLALVIIIVAVFSVGVIWHKLHEPAKALDAYEQTLAEYRDNGYRIKSYQAKVASTGDFVVYDRDKAWALIADQPYKLQVFINGVYVKTHHIQSFMTVDAGYLSPKPGERLSYRFVALKNKTRLAWLTRYVPE